MYISRTSQWRRDLERLLVEVDDEEATKSGSGHESQTPNPINSEVELARSQAPEMRIDPAHYRRRILASPKEPRKPHSLDDHRPGRRQRRP